MQIICVLFYCKGDYTLIFGSVSAIFLSVGNLSHLFFTICICIEQAKTGFGFVTNMELAVIYPWIIEIIFFPALICGFIYTILHLRKKTHKKLFVINLTLSFVLLSQYVITNLFIAI